MAERIIPPLTDGQLEAVCRVLADTSTGLTGSEIGHTLAQVRVKDVDSGNTKWKRLYNAFVARQNFDQNGNKVFAFISKSMDPARYEGNSSTFEERRRRLNVTLAYLGYEFCDDGNFHKRSKATTKSEAENRADRLRAALVQRNVHSDVLDYCRAELLENNCFHAVLEACKSVAAKIRAKTGLMSDGASLINEALGGKNPRLRINQFASETEQSEQRGLLNLAIGLFGVFRNPTSHAPRIEWPMKEEDALDLFCIASYLHRRLDSSHHIDT